MLRLGLAFGVLLLAVACGRGTPEASTPAVSDSAPTATMPTTSTRQAPPSSLALSAPDDELRELSQEMLTNMTIEPTPALVACLAKTGLDPDEVQVMGSVESLRWLLALLACDSDAIVDALVGDDTVAGYTSTEVRCIVASHLEWFSELEPEAAIGLVASGGLLGAEVPEPARTEQASGCGLDSFDAAMIIFAAGNGRSGQENFVEILNEDDVRHTVEAILANKIDDEMVSCIVVLDLDLGVAMSLSGQLESSLDEAQFTELTEALHACVPPDVLADSLASLRLGAADPDGVRRCLTDRFGLETGAGAFGGLAAVEWQQPVPEVVVAPALDVAVACVPAEVITERITYGLGAGFEWSTMDRGCVETRVDEEFVDAYWHFELGVQSFDHLSPLVTVRRRCTLADDSVLLRAIPADYVPWSGERGLAEVEPTFRRDAFDAPPPMLIDPTSSMIADLETSDGVISVRLFSDTAPVTVNNFVALANEGYYDGTTFHRVIDGFMAQGGDPTGLGTGGPGYEFDDEATALTPVDRRGLLVMANSGPDTNGSQFFITFAPAEHLNGSFAVFGQVIAGDDSLRLIDLRDPQATAWPGESLLSIRIRAA